MSRETINPESLYDSLQYGFSHAAQSSGGKTIHCAGQVAWDKDCNLVGEGDIFAQAQQALRNLKDVLAAAGATPADVVRLRTYVVDHNPDKIPHIGAAWAEFFGDAAPAPNTLVGVQSLALPGFMIEIEATAQI